MSGIQQEKAALRARLLAARAGLADEQRAEAGRRIRDALLGLAEVQMAGTIAAYYSVGSEPDTRRLVYALWKRGSYVLLPLLRPVMSSTSSSPAATASSTTYWIAGLSTTGSISLGVALVAGRNLVPRPAAGMTALVTA